MQQDFTPIESDIPVTPVGPVTSEAPVAPAPAPHLPPVHPVRWTRHSAFLALMLVILAGSVLAIVANPTAIANIRDLAYLLPGKLNLSKTTMLTRSGPEATPAGTPEAVPSPKPDPYANPDGRFLYALQLGGRFWMNRSQPMEKAWRWYLLLSSRTLLAEALSQTRVSRDSY